MEDSTALAFHSALPDRVDKPEDTPRYVERDRRITTVVVLACPLALATMVTPMTSARELFPIVGDSTAFAEESKEEGLALPAPDTISAGEEAFQVSEADVANRT